MLWLMKEKGCCGYMECWDQVSAQIASLSFEYAQLTNGGQLYTGKTFLLGTIVNHAMTISPTAFVFLDHDHNINSHTSTLTVAHSFIFQLAIQNDNLQDIVRQSARSQLKNTLNVAVQVFIISYLLFGVLFSYLKFFLTPGKHGMRIDSDTFTKRKNTDFNQVLNFLDNIINHPGCYGVNTSQLPDLVEIVEYREG